MTYEDPGEGMTVTHLDKAGHVRLLEGPYPRSSELTVTIWPMDWVGWILCLLSAAITFFAIWGVVDFVQWLA